jgi:hypothetical protein
MIVHEHSWQKWWIDFIDKDGNKNAGLTGDFNQLPLMIANILRAGGRDIVITDKTIYKDDPDGQEKGKLYYLQGRG